MSEKVQNAPQGITPATKGMRLLICTQAVDLEDPYLGFFHRWLEEFSKYTESLEVVALRVGKHNLPQNVRAHSLGGAPRGAPPRGFARLMYRLRIALRFLSLVWQLRGRYDAVFVHMNPEYAVLGGPVWRALRKKVVLWYVHRAVSLYLRLAIFWAHIVFSAAPESFRVRTNKVRFVGNAVDSAFAQLGARRTPRRSLSAPLHLVVVGRVSPIKRLDVLIRALALARQQGVNAQLAIIGGPVTDADREYAHKLTELAREQGVEDYVVFEGPVAPSSMPLRLVSADIALNASPSGGVDKAGLEALASGLPLVASNTGYLSLFGEQPWLLMADDERAFAEHIVQLARLTPEQLADLGRAAQATVARKVSLETLVCTITTALA
ncbi:MAG: hypothetical protein KatS3mg100_118 [Candidatus Parcubacteria bacterium]|nr:MAG: hypothetical protein KatS3mg100_118 [Candidatus Parcubacteria bacterium]